jgi:predicted alpha/beta superfamily hydrolase
MTRRKTAAVMAALLVAQGLPDMSGAAPVSTPVRAFGAGAPVELPEARQRLLQSSTGREYLVYTAVPTEPAPPGGWPVVYVLDGNAWFSLFAQQSRLMARRPDKGGVVPAVIVGVGYPGSRPFNTERRTRDFTPPAPVRAPPPAPGGRSWSASGGADEFLAFLVKELRPLIEQEFKIDPVRQALFGHSLGGLFVLHALFTQPDSFQYFIAASPSVWWNDRYIIEEADSFAARVKKQGIDRSLLIAFGADELPEMVADPKALFERIKPLAGHGLHLQLSEIAHEEHVSVAPVAFNRLMRFALAATTKDLEFYKRLYAVAPGSAAQGAATPDGAFVPAMPGAAEYLAMTPDQRYELRKRVRALPKGQREAFEARLYVVLHEEIESADRQRLSDERIAYDKKHGTVPVQD